MNSLFLVAAVAVTVFASPALAEPSRFDTAHTVVATTDLDLASDAGVRALDRRILVAASTLCGTPSAAIPRARAMFERCRDTARANAAAGRGRAIAAARLGQMVVAASDR